MVRHADTEVTVIKEEVFIPNSLEAGDIACHAGPHEEASGPVRRQRNEGKP